MAYGTAQPEYSVTLGQDEQLFIRACHPYPITLRLKLDAPLSLQPVPKVSRCAKTQAGLQHLAETTFAPNLQA